MKNLRNMMNMQGAMVTNSDGFEATYTDLQLILILIQNIE